DAVEKLEVLDAVARHDGDAIAGREAAALAQPAGQPRRPRGQLAIAEHHARALRHGRTAAMAQTRAMQPQRDVHGRAPEVCCGPTAYSHLAPLAGRGRFASGALAKRSKSGEGAFPQAQPRGGAPSPGFLRSAALRSESDLSPRGGERWSKWHLCAD